MMLSPVTRTLIPLHVMKTLPLPDGARGFFLFLAVLKRLYRTLNSEMLYHKKYKNLKAIN